MTKPTRTPRPAPSFISVIVPVYNECASVRPLARRIARSLIRSRLHFEVLFMDDQSLDGTAEAVRGLPPKFRARLIEKNGRRGKWLSILQGVRHAKGDALVFIDGDLQYAPEAIPSMLRKLSTADVVVANRTVFQTSFFRRSLSHAVRYVCGRLLPGLDQDVQSGLKAVRASVLESVSIRPSSWGADAQLLYKAKRAGFHIDSVNITLHERRHGHSKVNFFTGVSVFWQVLLMRFETIQEAFVWDKTLKFQQGRAK